MKIYDQMKQVLEGREGDIITAGDLKRELQLMHGTNPSSVIPSDFCYNRFNNGITFTKHLFVYLTKSTYKYIGEYAKYTGMIFHKSKSTQEEVVIGEWKDGVKTLYPADLQNRDTISPEQIKNLYEEYIRVLRFELQVLSCQPTELRHLIGRIGELYCAMMTDGQLARETNQHGFDVVSQGRLISVKTTAQQSNSFVVFNKNTFEKFDDVFVVQYRDDDFHILYYGSKTPVEDIARTYKNMYEVDLEKLKKLDWGKDYKRMMSTI
ncbi:hypothetical protein CSV69_07820 [Sporosarcina sp. P26b]|uniref:DUF7225 domain-containing protein n=1 Tax=Sporosarcina sp. P26b TaxID=2048253 RepID=UPI000C163AD6|nr:hypothetical protein [Sporosarcina sp. P26b]PIC96374.1 hypothetical protein CSV69_07820 [Sporosarcina sp. P26b]